MVEVVISLILGLFKSFRVVLSHLKSSWVNKSHLKLFMSCTRLTGVGLVPEGSSAPCFFFSVTFGFFFLLKDILKKKEKNSFIRQPEIYILSGSRQVFHDLFSSGLSFITFTWGWFMCVLSCYWFIERFPQFIFLGTIIHCFHLGFVHVSVILLLIYEMIFMIHFPSDSHSLLSVRVCSFECYPFNYSIKKFPWSIFFRTNGPTKPGVESHSTGLKITLHTVLKMRN